MEFCETLEAVADDARTLVCNASATTVFTSVAPGYIHRTNIDIYGRGQLYERCVET